MWTLYAFSTCKYYTDRICTECGFTIYLVKLCTPDLLVLPAEEFVRGEVAVEVLLDVLGAARVAACLCEPAPGAGGRGALHPELGAAEVEPGARAAAGRDPLAAPLPHLLVVPAHHPLVRVCPRPAN